MTADAELSDARQSLFSEVILRYGHLLGREEHLQRGEAALRASFSMMYCPENPSALAQWQIRWPFLNKQDYGFMMENYGHDGRADELHTGIGEFTIYDWGNGAASEAVMRVMDHGTAALPHKGVFHMHKPKILVVGSFVMDLIVSTDRFPNSGETVLGRSYRTAPGGKGANQAVQAARLGADVTMVGKVGQDSFGQELLSSASASGVDVSRVIRDPEAPSAVGNVQLEVTPAGTANRIIVVSGANMTITPADVAFLEEEIRQFDLVILQLEIPMEINCLVASWAKRKGVPVMLNSAPYAPIPDALLACTSYISPNEHEAALLTRLPVDTDAHIADALHALQSLGVQHALITLGSRGVACLNDEGEVVTVPALKGLDVKDPTAAGDSFVGAFCVAVCLGVPLEQALRFANHTAAITVCRMGAQPSLPTIGEVLDLMRSRGEDTAPFQGLCD